MYENIWLVLFLSRLSLVISLFKIYFFIRLTYFGETHDCIQQNRMRTSTFECLC